MSKEHNSKLISELYQTTNEDRLVDILEEITGINDPIFLYPIHDKYKLFQNSTISHYFISCIVNFGDDEAKKIITEIASDAKTRASNFIWLLDFLPKFNIFESHVVARAESLLCVFDYKNDSEFDFTTLLSYIKKSGSLEKFADILKSVFENGDQKSSLRRTAFKYLLRINPAHYFRHYFENYGDIKKNHRTELLFVQEIISGGWHGGLIPKLKEKILQEGGSRAKEVLEIKKQEEDKAEKKETEAKYPNVDIVTAIYELRMAINAIFLSGFSFELFPPVEILHKQNKSAQTEPELVDFLMDLRELVQKISDQCKHNLDFSSAVKIIPTLAPADINKSLSRLHLFLFTKNIQIDDEVFGMKKLNGILNKFAHPVAKEKINALKDLGLDSIYAQGDWTLLHKKFLELYKDSLVRLQKAIN